jgi:hypothetical protein
LETDSKPLEDLHFGAKLCRRFDVVHCLPLRICREIGGSITAARINPALEYSIS